MNTNLPEKSREELITFYMLGFFVVLGASLGSFVYVFSGFLTFILLSGCAAGCMLLIKHTYFSGFNLGYAQKPETYRAKSTKRMTENIRPLRTSTAHLELVYSRNRAKS